MYHSFPVMSFFRKSGSLGAVWVKSLATVARGSFCCGSRSHRKNFAITRFMPRSRVKIPNTVVFGIPRSASGSLTDSRRSLLIAARTYSQVFWLLQAFQNVDHLQQILDHLWSVHATLLFVLHSLHRPWKPSESSKQFKLNAKSDADSLLYSLSHSERNGPGLT